MLGSDQDINLLLINCQFSDRWLFARTTNSILFYQIPSMFYCDFCEKLRLQNKFKRHLHVLFTAGILLSDYCFKLQMSVFSFFLTCSEEVMCPDPRLESADLCSTL